ncbi:hypothetical protein MMC14_007492 [Varicellaria rhodocarpa]|nr:hypothetical protein [Varicellaria rhodocarpa]
MLYTLKQWCAVGFSLPSQKEPTDSSNTGVNISLATEADVEDLALVCTKAIETDLLHGLIHQRGKTEHAYDNLAEHDAPDYIPNYMNGELYTFCSRESEALHRKHLNGQNHVVLSYLLVPPAFRDQEIVSELLTWGFTHFGLARETLWVVASVCERLTLLRYGWEDVDHADFDLSKWAGKNKGYGSYRMQMMIRRPKELECKKEDMNEKSW